MNNFRTHDVVPDAVHWSMLLTAAPLTEAQQNDLNAWLAKDPSNGEALNEAMRVWDSLDADRLPPEFDAQRSAALRRFGAAKKQNNRHQKRRYWGMAAIAASLILAISIGGSLAFFKAREPVIYATLPAESRVVVLSDGSKVTLDADTSIKVQFRDNMRQVWLTKGRANFEVAGNPVRPFTVDASYRTVVATGTEFTVERLASELRVVLYEGHVAIMARKVTSNLSGSTPENSESYTETSLEPGSTYVYSTVAKSTRVSPSRKSDALDWQKGILAFDKEPLALAVERTNRYSGDKVILKDIRRQNITVSGVFKAGDQAAFADGVAAFHGLKVQQTETGYILSER
jgi:transmembrane sensor